MQNKPTIITFHQGGELYGSDLVFLRACHALSDHFSVISFIDFDGPLADKLRDAKITTRVMPLAALRKSTVRTPFKFILHLIKTLISLSKVFFTYKKSSKICYVNTLVIPFPLILAKLFGYKTVSHIHETLPQSIVGRVLYSAYALFSDEIILVSKTAQYAMLQNSPLKTKNKTNVIYNGIEKYCNESTIRSSKFKIVFIGRLSERKGLHILLLALTDTYFVDREWTLEIIGDCFDSDDPYLGRIKDILSHSNFVNRVHMTGFRPDARTLLRTGHLFVFPSIDFDSFPTVVLEAMAENVPIIATNTGGAAEMIENNISGILIPPSNVSAMQQAIASVFNDPEAAFDRSREAKKRVDEQFTLPIFESCFLSVFTDLSNFQTKPHPSKTTD